MKEHKHELLDFALFDYQYIQRHLTEMAARGWRLEKITSFGVWHYRRAEPAPVRYEVTYAPSASAYNSRPTESEEALSDLCAEAGWVKAASVAQLHIYCNEDPNATPLETDELSRIRILRKAMNRHFVPQYLLMIGLFLLQLTLQIHNVLRWPTRTLSSPLMVGNLLLVAFAVVTYAGMIAGYLHWVRRAEQAAAEGLEVPECVFYRRFRFVLWFVLVGYLAMLLLTADMWMAGSVLIVAAVSISVTGFTLDCCKDAGAPKWVNILVPCLACFFAMLLVLPLTFGFLDELSLSEEPDHPEEVPLMLADLLDLEGEATEKTILEESSSLLASCGRYWDESTEPDSELLLAYTIIDVEWDGLYDLCLNEQERQFLESASILSNGVVTLNQGDLWEAEYARRAPGDYNDRWLICWEDRIVSLRAGWPLTDEQITIAAEILKP